ncbi:MAG: helix-turn-helix transcriptional regulator [Rhodospirillaceae bacterium]|nr:helix-turn-helix transcriptional regulator [Rhodospirillaceae bacterium]
MSLRQATDGAVASSPKAWIAALGGEGVIERSYVEWPSLGIGYFRFDDLTEPLAAPAIDRHYISLTLGGPLEVEGILDGNRLRAEVRPGQFMFMAAGQSNAWRWDRPTEEAQIFLDPAIIDRVALEAGCGHVQLLNRFAIEDPHIQNIVLALLDELRQPGPGTALMAETAAQFLALHLLRRHCRMVRTVAPAGALTAGQIRRIEGHVAGRLDGGITLEELANVVGLSQFHFARAFRKATGESPHRWLTARRIARAKEMLQASSLSVLDISQEVGFQSQSHFGQVFRKWTGCTPAAWRSRARC